MRIALASTVCTPVRQTGAGSVEALVWVLARELVEMGHEVTVFAAAGSNVPGELVETLPGPYSTNGAPGDWHACEWINLCRAVERSDRFDVIHSHAYLVGVPLGALSRCRMVHTTHVQPHHDEAALRQQYPGSVVTAISNFQWAGFPNLKPAAVVPHGIDLESHTFAASPKDYLLFMGRFIPGKGPLEAVATAKALEMPLVLAGPQNDYFRRHVAPLVDGRDVRFVGPVGGEERDRLYGGARALLYPIDEAEPFGLVPVEAMLSGTPVAAVALGAVPELVEHGTTGALVSPGQDLAPAVEHCLRLERGIVSDVARKRFAARRMAESYASLYESLAA